jgi:hypothetical protein
MQTIFRFFKKALVLATVFLFQEIKGILLTIKIRCGTF